MSGNAKHPLDLQPPTTTIRRFYVEVMTFSLVACRLTVFSSAVGVSPVQARIAVLFCVNTLPHARHIQDLPFWLEDLKVSCRLLSFLVSELKMSRAFSAPVQAVWSCCCPC